jgi:hypothetical protein
MAHRRQLDVLESVERLRSLAGPGCKERDVSKNRDAGPVKCNALFGGILPVTP